MTTRVIKLGGRAQGDPRLPGLVATAARAVGTRIVIVHGGGDEVSAMQRRLGLEPTFIGGRRVTSDADLEIVRMLLSGTVNKRIVAQLAAAGARAVGVSGEDGGLLTARVGDAALGRVGRDVAADPALLDHLLDGGWLPVVSPLAREAGGTGGLNVNGDDAAAAIATALEADELLFVADVDGVREDGHRVPRLDPDGIRELAARGVAQGGMLAKLEAALSALAGGVQRVRVASLDAIAHPTLGTTIARTVHASEDHQ
ncbi:MAG: acetylglutamate kinase [Gemmatimonadaceae bacterium]